MENLFELGVGTARSLAGELCIAASAAHLAPLRLSSAMAVIGPAVMLEVEAGQDLPEAALAASRVLVIEVDPTEAATLRRVRQIRSDHPDLKIIAAIAEADVKLVKTLVRQGICDVAELPFQAEELAAQVLDAASDPLDLTTEVPLAPVYAVVRSVGGSGSTTVLTHLAAALAKQAPADQRICLADFDLQGGQVAAFAGVAAAVNLGTLLEAGDRLDDAVVGSAIVESGHGFAVVAAPDTIMPLDFASPEQIGKILTSLRRQFAYVLVDLPADWTNWSLSIATAAHRILFVTDSSIASLRQGRRKIDLLESVGVERTSIKLIANHTERRMFRTVGTVSTDDIATTLRAEVVASLSEENGALRAAQDQGMLLSDTAGRTPFVRNIAEIAQRLLAGEI